MLIQFTIQNFLSFRDEVTFSMVGVNSDNQHVDHLSNNEAGEGKSILPLAAIYGANAAGKSNLIKAISFVRNLVVKGTRSGQIISLPQFKLDDHRSQSSKFELIFTYKGAQYSYGFRLNREEILEEWLHGIPKNRKREVKYFERITLNKKETTIEFGKQLKGTSEKYQLRLGFIAEGTRPNQLFLTEAVDRNIQILFPIVDWFKNVLTIISAEANFIGLENKVHNDEIFTDFLSKFLQFADTGINSIATQKAELNFDRHFPAIPKQMREELIQKIDDLDKNSAGIIESNQGARLIVSKDDEGRVNVTELRTIHLSENGNLIDFSLDEESEGTQRLINLVPSLFLLNQDSEKVIFLDELDRRLHPLLSRYFVETAISCRNKNNQLIFTTHDTNLLDLDLLRRDEIWFVEKNKNGVSDCYSLVEFKIRPDLKIEKGYLNARFGAIPFFGDPQKLGWINCKPDTSNSNL
jgi:uncharacterized protein